MAIPERPMLEVSPSDDPAKNLEAFRKENEYPGRFFGVGLSQDGKSIIIVYGITVRSEPNRNRILVFENGVLRTAIADPNKDSGVANIILYPAVMRTADGRFVVSNGVQTESIVEALDRGETLEQELENWEYEKDSNSTERISGLVSKNRGVFGRISRRSEDGEESQRDFYQIGKMEPGIIKVIHTYAKNGTPTPASHAQPYGLPIEGKPSEIAQAYRENLGPFFLSVGVMSIDWETMNISRVEILNAAQPSVT